jgi:hypothetical protein
MAVAVDERLLAAAERDEPSEPAAFAEARARWLAVSEPLAVDDDPDWPAAEAA